MHKAVFRRLRPWMLSLLPAVLLLGQRTPCALAQEQDGPYLYGPTRLIASEAAPAAAATVTLRKFPYPYRAMLAIASDADGMTLRKFMLIHRYLNTDEETPLGRGLGMDIGDSFFFFIGTDRPGVCDTYGTPWQDQMSYFRRLSTTELHDAKAIVTFMRAGWIDSLHGLGDFSMQNEKESLFKRSLALAAAKEMRENGMACDIWINHGNRSNAHNFGNPESAYQQGDVPESKHYVTDIMIPVGIRFVWTRRDNEFGRKQMLYPIVLRDGHRVWGFYRFTDDGYSKQGQVLWNWNPLQLGSQLSAAHLQELEQHGHYAIVAQHLGSDAANTPFYGDNLEGLVRLMREYKHGRILVARTSRLLHYQVAQQFLQYGVDVHDGRVGIHALRIADPVLGTHVPTLLELRGITFYTKHPLQTDLYIGNQRISAADTVCNPPDHTGSPSIGIRWFAAQTGDVSHLLPPSLQTKTHRLGPPAPPATNNWQEHFTWSDSPL